jgi:tagatose 1,6-diphosphate aldolase
MEATRLIGPHTDILKLEFPGDIRNDSSSQLEDNLKKLNEAAIRPWVLLSAGEKFDLFVKQTELAMKAGCSGYMAGRAIFNEYFEQKDSAAQDSFLATTAAQRMQTLNKIVDSSALAWTNRYNIEGKDLAAAVDPKWYLGGKAPANAASPKQAAAVTGDY